MAGAALRPVRIGERCVQFRAKRLEFHRSLEGLELVTEIAQPLPSIIHLYVAEHFNQELVGRYGVFAKDSQREISQSFLETLNGLDQL